MRVQLTFAALCALSALGLLSPNVSKASDPLMVFACEPEWAALASTIGGDRVEIFAATTAKQDPHYVRAKPSLLAKIRRSDLLFCTGADLEVGWLPVLIQRAPQTLQPGQIGYLMATDYVTLLDQNRIVDRSQGDIHPHGNPHIHPNPNHVLTVAAELNQRLQIIDSENKSHYQNNFDEFEKQWQQAIARWTQQGQPLRGRKIVIHHAAWRYLADWLGLEVIATLEPKPGIPPTSRHLQSVVDMVRGSGDVLAIVRTPYDPAKPSEWLENKTAVPALELPYTVGGSAEADNMISLFDQTLKKLTDVAR